MLTTVITRPEGLFRGAPPDLNVTTGRAVAAPVTGTSVVNATVTTLPGMARDTTKG